MKTISRLVIVVITALMVGSCTGGRCVAYLNDSDAAKSIYVK